MQCGYLKPTGLGYNRLIFAYGLRRLQTLQVTKHGSETEKEYKVINRNSLSNISQHQWR